MQRLSKFLITLPLPSLPLWGLSSHVHAEAVLSQMDALRLLAVAGMLRRARAQAVAMECGARSRQLVRAEYARLDRN
jgi:hypothetical protein